MSGRRLNNGRYELEKLPLARGGMGEVWLGRDTKLDREVAVKFIRFPDGARDDEHIRRFVRESRITARLEHPGVPAVYDVGVGADGRPFLVMQRVHGISVADLVAEQGPLPIGWAAAIAAQVCAVLAAAHRASLVHRDLKPSNLMLEPDGRVKVLDFGLAVAPTLADFSKITHTGQPLGTPAYMAPEQVEANLSSPATDLYALGCTLHEMLSGEHLFSGSTSYSVMSKQVKEQPPRLRSLRADAPPALERLLLDLLKKEPQSRPASAEVVFDRLLPFATDLGPLPGVLDPPATTSSARMYAAVLSRVFAQVKSAAPANVPVPRQRVQPVAVEPALHRSDLERVRSEAHQLIAQSRYSQAADVLAEAAGPAGRSFGPTDRDVVDLRFELANVLFEGGDYRRAAPAYHDLGKDLAVDDSRIDLLLRCRLQEATCHALTGQSSHALSQLQDVLRAYRQAYGDGDPRTLELRRQIGLLELGTGQRQAAEQTLSALLADLKRAHNPANPSTTEVADLLASLRRSRLGEKR
ncbi:serine/threonine protein kinase [Asanoa ferruginea]|uniref:non-specific serine/threonine protein kinase n=1 Tax=Asanoa ferruginea TaxID=53367 RepID=A0A3D9ZJW4_9ACTN|nr:serine/threonine-protein kinase [Asanoa ferruginea]REF97507.1 serine/threonine protein kinase [Asanoa ferruginea]GIF48205.1 protein kinase [Asanoa ferruginea]